MFPSLENKIVVLGAGFSGLEVIKRLKKVFGNSIDITVVDKKPYFTYNPNLFALLSGKTNKKNVIIPYKKLFEGLSIDFVQDEVVSINSKVKSVVLANSELKYDYLVVCLGSQVKFNNLPRSRERLMKFNSYEDVIQIQDHVKKHFESMKKVKNLENKKNKLTFVVCGGGLTGIELVTALKELVDKNSRKYRIPREHVDVTLIEGNELLSELDRRSADYVERQIEKMGIHLVLGKKVTRIDDKRIYLEGGRSISTDTVLWCGGVMPVKSLFKTDLRMQVDGGLVVNEYLQSVSDKGVYALGDNVHFQKEDLSPVRKSFIHAIDKGRYVAMNLVVDITKEGDKFAYRPKDDSYLFRLGRKQGVYHGNNLFFTGYLIGLAKYFGDHYNVWSYKRDFDSLRKRR